MSVEGLIDRTPPLPSSATGADAHARFQNAPLVALLAVVDGEGRPIGLLERNSVLAAMATEEGRAAHGAQPALGLAQGNPLVFEAGAAVGDVCRAMLAAPGAQTASGFAVVREGRYEGVGTVLALLGGATAAASRDRSRFLGVMGQNFRPPLNSILAIADLLERQPLSPDARTQVRTLIDTGRSLTRALSEAIELSRVEIDGVRLAPRPTRLRDLMDELQTAWLPQAVENGVGLGVAYLGEPDDAAELDPERLKQVFDQLIGAALSRTRRGGVEVGLEVLPRGGRLRLCGRVRDTGPSVDPAQLATLFEAAIQYRQGPDLGPAACRTLLEAMGGGIWAETNAGSGVDVRFEIEAPACVRAGDQAGLEAGKAAELHGHVLIVDDNATNRMVAQTLVELLGCTVETAEDGLEALEAVRRKDFDAILMDIRMPRMDGVEATRAIRALPGPARATPVIALTANADPDEVRRYLASGMVSVVEKPMKAERLLTALSEALAGPGVDRAAAAA